VSYGLSHQNLVNKVMFLIRAIGILVSRTSQGGVLDLQQTFRSCHYKLVPSRTGELTNQFIDELRLLECSTV
jgi:hypothetical protein